jgi:hypothetical protein
MAKVIHPLFSGTVRGSFGKHVIYRRGGVVTKYFVPRDPKSAGQLAQRAYFLEHYVGSLTQEQADLLYSAILHLHDDVYSPLAHGHDHGGLAGLGDDDHGQYYNQARGDARYPLIAHTHSYKVPIFGHMLSVGVPGSTVWNWCPGTVVFGTTANNMGIPFAGVLRNLRMQTVSAQPAGGSLVAAVAVQNVVTALAFTVVGGEAAGIKSNLVNEVAFNAGDAIRVVFTNNNIGTSCVNRYFSFEIGY